MKRNFKYKINGMSVILMVLTACSTDTLPDNGTNLRTEIRFTSVIEEMTRAYTPKQETVIKSGEKVYVWVDEATNKSSLFNAWELTADGSGGLNVASDAEKKYFPDSDKGIDVYAIHGNFSNAIVKEKTEFPGSAIVHTVETNQTADGNLEKSDLLYASKQNIDNTKEQIPLKFFHLLSKVQVAIRPGEELSMADLEGATVSLLNTKIQVRFSPDKASDLSSADTRGKMVEATGDASDIILPTASVDYSAGEFTTADNYGEAIIAPQTLEANTHFIKIAVEGRVPYLYKLKTDNTFESGKRYIYHITVNKTELDVTTSIDDWEYGPDNIVEAVPVVKVGDYYYADGTYSSELDNQKTLIGIVFSIGHNPYDKSDYSDTGIGQAKCKGYVVALEDATNSECKWGNSFEAIGNHPVEGDGSPFDNYHNPDKDWSGFAYTQAIISKAGGEEYLDDSNTYPATYYATVSYEEKIAAPAGSSGWFLPSIGQIYEVFLNRDFLFGKGGNNLKDEWYWSSSESGGDPGVYALFLYVNNSDADSYPKDASSCYVRPILAF